MVAREISSKMNDRFSSWIKWKKYDKRLFVSVLRQDTSSVVTYRERLFLNLRRRKNQPRKIYRCEKKQSAAFHARLKYFQLPAA